MRIAAAARRGFLVVCLALGWLMGGPPGLVAQETPREEATSEGGGRRRAAA